MSLPIPHHRFTVADFYRMVEAGILTEDDRVELLEGEIVEMTPIGRRHAAVVDRLNYLLTRSAGEGEYTVRVQNPVRLDESTEVQPDIAVLRYREDFYANNHPGPDDTLWIVEVSESSSDYDRNVKLPIYARAGISEVWVIDLKENVIGVYTGPSSEGYTEAKTFRPGDTVRSSTGFTTTVDKALLQS